MEYLTLYNGVQMPLVGFGTFMLGGETCANAVAAAIQSGYRMIDTAEPIGTREVFAELFTGEGDVVFLRFLLLHHDVQHGIVVELSLAGEHLHPLCL